MFCICHLSGHGELPEKRELCKRRNPVLIEYHHSMETQTIQNCALSIFSKYCFYFVHNCNGNPASEVFQFKLELLADSQKAQKLKT